MKRSAQEIRNRQLYILFSNLDREIPRQDDRGLLVSYAVIDSLLRFTPKSRAKIEQQHEEVKAVHDCLEKILDLCSKQEPVQILLELQAVVDTPLRGYLQPTKEPTYSGASILLKYIVESLRESKGNYVDKLRRRGLKLISNVQNTGHVFGNINIYTRDYESIKRSLQGETW